MGKQTKESAADIYQMVTDRIIAALEGGVIPWHKPWCGVRGGAFNRISGKPYSIINQMILGIPGEYATFKQWESIGGKVRKGEKSRFVVFWKVYAKPLLDENGEPKLNEDGEELRAFLPVLKHYRVFHISQVDGVSPMTDDELEELLTRANTRDESAEDILHGFIDREDAPAFVETKSNRAFYRPSEDKVVVPLREQYEVMEEYYSTCFHELTHSTGHSSRLARKEIGNSFFGDHSYSKEELVAEIGASMLCEMAGLDTSKSFDNSAAYIKSWLSALRNDKKLIISAAGRAEKAVRYILGEKVKEVAA